MRISQWWDRHIDTRVELTDGTIGLMRDTQKKLEALFGDVELGAIDVEAAERWKAWLVKECGLSLFTVHRHLRTARAAFRQAVVHKQVSENPFAHVQVRTGRPDRDWAYISESDLERIIATAKTPQWKLIFAICRLAGLRRGEAIRLRRGDIDFTTGVIRIRTERGFSTTKQAARIVPIVPKLRSYLELHCPAGSPGPCCEIPRSNMQRNAESIIKAAGLSTYSKPFHTLRKNCESDWLSRYPVMDVCRWLGHSPAVAMQHYHQTTAQTLSLATGIPPAA